MLFKATTKVDKSEYVDYYEADTKDKARALWEKDREEFGLPDTAEVEIQEE